METVYFYCAVVGGTVLVAQTLMLVFLGHGSSAAADAVHGVDVADAHVADAHVGDVHVDDVHADGHDASDSFFKLLSLKTLVAFLTFFGLTGMASLSGGLDPTLTLLAAFAAGFAALYVVANLMTALARLQSRGNLDLHNAVGKSGRVYLKIPADRSGSGRVTIAVQGRRIEVRAVTPGPEIPTGTEVLIVSLVGGNTLEVKPLAEA